MPLQPMKRIHVIFKTHLDIGFTRLGRDVIHLYFTRYIPEAIRLAKKMREQTGRQPFRWTVGSWLIYQYLERSDRQKRQEMEEAILAGDLLWHALPFTTHTELMDPGLFRRGLQLSKALDQRFGTATTAAKLTDVPGHTRGIVPLLAEAGVRFLHIGINPASTVPQTPPAFRWRHAGGAEVVVLIQSGYGKPFCLNGMEDGLAFCHSDDNLGPPTADGVAAFYARLEREYPHASAKASSLDDYGDLLWGNRERLPVFTGEMGDSWIHGAGSDPLKVSRYRELCRLSAAESAGNTACWKYFRQALLMIPEHTWGLDEKTHLHDPLHFAGSGFRLARQTCAYRAFERSWREKREILKAAVHSLRGTGFEAAARERLDSLKPEKPRLADWRPAECQTPAGMGNDQITFGHTVSAITRLPGSQGSFWADALHPLFWLRYQTFDAADYKRFYSQYILPSAREWGWTRMDFTKPGLENSPAVSQWWQPALEGVFARGESLLALYRAPARAHTLFGCPKLFTLQIDPATTEGVWNVALQWFEKPACRMPEAIWLGFCPPAVGRAQMRMHKLGDWIDPLEVVAGGNRHLHAVQDRVRWWDEKKAMEIETLDAVLVAPGEPSLLDFSNDLPDLAQGFHINLYNNVWGTNFPMWFDESMRFRFTIKLTAEFFPDEKLTELSL